MNVAVSTHLFLYYDPVEDGVLEAVSRAGFGNVELWAMKPHFPYDDPDRIERLRAEADRVGLSFVSAHLPLYEKVHPPGKPSSRFSPSSDDAAVRSMWKREASSAASAAASLGATCLTLHTDVKFPGPDHREDILLESLAAFIDEDLPDGAVLSLENDPGGAEQVEGLAAIASKLDTSRVGITVDIGHALMGGDPIESMKIASHLLASVHASDNDATADDHLPPGRGVMPWEEAFETLDAMNFKGPFVWELRDPTGGNDPGIGKLKSMLEEIREFDRTRS